MGIKTALRIVRKDVQTRIAAQTDQSNLYSRGLAYEGYNGGYLQCLNDIEQALNKVKPGTVYWNNVRM